MPATVDKRNGFKARSPDLKPRERMAAAGTAAVASATELLAVILKTGTRGCDVMELSSRLIDAFGGVENLVRSDLASLKGTIAAWNGSGTGRKILGLGPVKLLELAAAFELARRGYASAPDARKAVSTPADAALVFRGAMRLPSEKEAFWVLPLDIRRRPIVAPQQISVGTVDGVGVHPRDVFAIAVRWNAHSIMVAHNHPSGSAYPSRKDEDLTRRLREAASAMGIPLIDHLVVTENAHYSFAQEGKLNEP